MSKKVKNPFSPNQHDRAGISHHRHREDQKSNIERYIAALPFQDQCELFNRVYAGKKQGYGESISKDILDACVKGCWPHVAVLLSSSSSSSPSRVNLKLAESKGKGKGNNIFHHLCKYGNVTFLRQLGQNLTDDIVDIRDGNNYTALMNAVLDKNLEVVKWLIQVGANVNALNEFHQTPLYVAVDQNNIDMVKLLLSTYTCFVNGYDENDDDIDYDPPVPLTLAVEKGYLDIVKILTEHPDCNWIEISRAFQNDTTGEHSGIQKEVREYLVNLLAW
jgi:ankyrin repeat protein